MKGRTALLSNQTGVKDWLEVVDIKDNKVYKEPPEHCSNCGGHKIVGLEILGAHTDYLFWECLKCQEKHLRFTKAYTRKLLNKLNTMSINLEDFIDIENKEPN
tara:strand:- start:3110 stop:3418 length:309 start_codon:yes stop_codon:yes gene_type:complete